MDYKSIVHVCYLTLALILTLRSSIAQTKVDLNPCYSNAKISCQNLKSNNIKDLTTVEFENNVEVVDLDSNDIREIPDHIFPEKSSWKELWMNDNRIKTIGKEAWNGLSKLRVLMLMDNRLDYLFSNMFRSLPDLIVLRLDENRIASLDPECFNNLHQLRRLTLFGNHIRNLDANVSCVLQNNV